MTRIYCYNCGKQWELTEEACNFLCAEYGLERFMPFLDSLKKTNPCCNHPKLLYALDGENLRKAGRKKKDNFKGYFSNGNLSGGSE